MYLLLKTSNRVKTNWWRKLFFSIWMLQLLVRNTFHRFLPADWLIEPLSTWDVFSPVFLFGPDPSRLYWSHVSSDMEQENKCRPLHTINAVRQCPCGGLTAAVCFLVFTFSFQRCIQIKLNTLKRHIQHSLFFTVANIWQKSLWKAAWSYLDSRLHRMLVFLLFYFLFLLGPPLISSLQVNVGV